MIKCIWCGTGHCEKPPGKKQLKCKKGHEDQMTEVHFCSLLFFLGLSQEFSSHSWIKAANISRGVWFPSRWYGLNLASQVEVNFLRSVGKTNRIQRIFLDGKMLLSWLKPWSHCPVIFLVQKLEVQNGSCLLDDSPAGRPAAYPCRCPAAFGWWGRQDV